MALVLVSWRMREGTSLTEAVKQAAGVSLTLAVKEAAGSGAGFLPFSRMCSTRTMLRRGLPLPGSRGECAPSAFDFWR